MQIIYRGLYIKREEVQKVQESQKSYVTQGYNLDASLGALGCIIIMYTHFL